MSRCATACLGQLTVGRRNYRPSSLKQLPLKMRAHAFVTLDDELCLKDEYRAAIAFAVQDIRERSPEGRFHLILCRNLVFTYFDERSQIETLQRLTESLVPGGALIIGKLESLPKGPCPLETWSKSLAIYRKTPDNT
jgi:chemotaxis protein methyltransferase CheR